MFVDFDVEPENFALTNVARLDDKRTYYIHKDLLFLLVLRNNLTIRPVAGHTVDANVGWDAGTPGYVDNTNIGKRHSKITVYRLCREDPAETQLSVILADAPYS